MRRFQRHFIVAPGCHHNLATLPDDCLLFGSLPCAEAGLPGLLVEHLNSIVLEQCHAAGKVC